MYNTCRIFVVAAMCSTATALQDFYFIGANIFPFDTRNISSLPFATLSPHSFVVVAVVVEVVVGVVALLSCLLSECPPISVPISNQLAFRWPNLRPTRTIFQIFGSFSPPKPIKNPSKYRPDLIQIVSSI